jgi:hypothetical protein
MLKASAGQVISPMLQFLRGAVDQGGEMAAGRDSMGAFDLGRLFSRAMQMIGRHLLLFVLLAILLAGVPSALMQYFFPVEQAADLARLTSVSFWGPFMITTLLGVLLQAVLIRLALDPSGEDAQMSSVLLEALSLLFRFIGLYILVMLAVMVGMILLIIPGIMIAVALSVAFPVLVAEKQGIFASMGRSRELTKGSRWWIFLLFVIYLVVSGMLGGVVGFFSVFAASGVLALVINAVIQSVAPALFAAIVTSLYLELRIVREGGPDGLTAVFE